MPENTESACRVVSTCKSRGFQETGQRIYLSTAVPRQRVVPQRLVGAKDLLGLFVPGMGRGDGSPAKGEEC